MSSSQIMTAPAVGHQPSDTGRGRSRYEYTGPQSDDHQASPRNGAAISAGLLVEGTQNNGSSFSEDDLKKQQEREKQTAASSLLAQLLGRAPPPSPPRPQPPYSPLEPRHELPEEKNVSETLPSTVEFDQSTVQRQTLPPSSREILDSSESEMRSGDQITSRDAGTGINGDPLSSAVPAGSLLGEPLPKTDQAFCPYEPGMAPKNPAEALQQNELLASSFLSKSAELLFSGLPDVTSYMQSQSYEPATSTAGSEPRIQAFAKLEFDDGHFYVNTYSFILGRDVRAARAAYQRELQARQARAVKHKSSSGGNTSHTPNRVKREGSALIGSVVSDRGGIMGFDPGVPPHFPPQLSQKSSNSSRAGSGLATHATPAQLQASHTDYNALAIQSLYEGSGDAKPVDTLALLPSPDACPTIPIHPPAAADGSAAGHKGISRKHVKIAYNFDKNLFEMEVMGRNGAFIGVDWLAPGQIRPLHSGDYIQIGGVRIRFLLPDVPIGETGADRVDESYLDEDENDMLNSMIDDEGRVADNADGDDNVPHEQRVSKGKSKGTTKINLKTKGPGLTDPGPSIEGPPNAAQQPPRRRGPGRPPKDGIMSKRERAEIAREQKLAARREANGGVTPPPSNRSKVGRPRNEGPTADDASTPKLEKRKYTKRKKLDGTFADIPVSSIEGGEVPLDQLPEDYPKPVKKRKPSRSPSPDYPPESAYTLEDLAKPPYNYAVLIFDALTESRMPMTLKQIYRALKLKYPYFRFKCETEGWTSSVRHNLNGNGHLFMHAERDGKGWSWQLRPGASVEKEKRRRPSPPPPPLPPSQPPGIPIAAAAAPSTKPERYVSPGTHTHGPLPAVMDHRTNQRFQSPSAYTSADSALQNPGPYLPISIPFPLSNPLRNSLPPAFAQTTPTPYTSPYASDPPPALVQLRKQQQQAQLTEVVTTEQHPCSFPQNILRPTNSNIYSQDALAYTPPPGHPLQDQVPVPRLLPRGSLPIENEEIQSSASFIEQAHKAIDDFETVLIKDFEDKEYIREVLKSARARVLGGAQTSSFPGGEPKDEAVIVDTLQTLIGRLKEESNRE